MSSTLVAVAAQLYLSLHAMPCRCQKHWQDGKPEMVTTLICSRCLALSAYEALQEKVDA